MVRAGDYIKMDQTVVEDTRVIVFVKKYGRPTLLEEQERRVVHEVTISAKKTTSTSP